VLARSREALKAMAQHVISVKNLGDEQRVYDFILLVAERTGMTKQEVLREINRMAGPDFK